MITRLKRYVARRRFKPVVSTLPRRLARAFGVDDHCTFLQAKRVISDLGLPRSVEPYALAAVCRLDELQKGNVPLSAQDYRRLRTELVDLFRLRSADFTIKDLIATPYSSHSPAQESLVGGPSSGDAPGPG